MNIKRPAGRHEREPAYKTRMHAGLLEADCRIAERICAVMEASKRNDGKPRRHTVRNAIALGAVLGALAGRRTP